MGLFLEVDQMPVSGAEIQILFCGTCIPFFRGLFHIADHANTVTEYIGGNGLPLFSQEIEFSQGSNQIPNIVGNTDLCVYGGFIYTFLNSFLQGRALHGLVGAEYDSVLPFVYGPYDVTTCMGEENNMVFQVRIFLLLFGGLAVHSDQENNKYQKAKTDQCNR